MLSLGLKLWSTFTGYIPHARELYVSGVFQYIELFTVPNSYESVHAAWSALKIPYILHAPHSLGGMNPSLETEREKNIRTVGEVNMWKKILDPGAVIFHPGIDGSLDETIYQFNMFADTYPDLWAGALVENKPLRGLNNEHCLGSTREELEKIIGASGCGFCLDFGHATCAAFSHGVDPLTYIRDLNELAPKVYHLSDGHHGRECDEHLNLGAGEYDFASLLSVVPENSMISLETAKASKTRLDDFVEDVNRIRRLAPSI